MTERDELIDLIWVNGVSDRVRSGIDAGRSGAVVRARVEDIADKIIAAGWSK